MGLPPLPLLLAEPPVLRQLRGWAGTPPPLLPVPGRSLGWELKRELNVHQISVIAIK